MDPNSAPDIHQDQPQSECPKCGTPRLRAIYGLPTSEFTNDPTVKIMGCLFDGKSSEWFCPECDNSEDLG